MSLDVTDLSQATNFSPILGDDLLSFVYLSHTRKTSFCGDFKIVVISIPLSTQISSVSCLSVVVGAFRVETSTIVDTSRMLQQRCDDNDIVGLSNELASFGAALLPCRVAIPQ